MIRIPVSQAAFDAVATTLPLGSVSYENEIDEERQRLVDRRNRQRLPRCGTIREAATRPNLVCGRVHSDGGFPKSCACVTSTREDGSFGITLDVWADSRFWLLWLGLSHSAVRHRECRGRKSPCGSRHHPRRSLPWRLDQDDRQPSVSVNGSWTLPAVHRLAALVALAGKRYRSARAGEGVIANCVVSELSRAPWPFVRNAVMAPGEA
jgi:hypothetical protein